MPFEYDSSENALILRREVLRMSLEEELTNPAYKEYCYETGPLTLDQINDGLVDIDALQSVVATYSWPTETHGDFYTSRGFTLAKFHKELFLKEAENNMTNFRARLKVPLIHDASETSTMLGWYGLSPELHRAYAIAPSLMNGIHETFQTFEHLDMFDAAKGMKDYLKDEQNDAVLKAVFVAYNMMARLIKPEEGLPGDKDSHDALTH